MLTDFYIENEFIFRHDIFRLFYHFFAECPLAEFVTSPSDQEKIPFVFLPLASGQTVYPSARIRILDDDESAPISLSEASPFTSDNFKTTSTGEEANVNEDKEPICVVSSTDLLYKDGWNNLEKIYNGLSSSRIHSSNRDTEAAASQNFYHHPLRLVQQQNAKTYLQVT